MPLTRTKHTLPNKIGWIGYAFYVALILVSAEFFLRMAIFSESFKISKLREPSLYADYLNEDDYWKLYHRFGGPCNPLLRQSFTLSWAGRQLRSPPKIHSD